MVLALCYANCFAGEYGKLRREPPDLGTQENFSFGLCDFFRYACDPDMRLCCCSCCCLPLRWADTVSSHKVGFGNFWFLVFFFTLLQVVVPLHWSLFLLTLILTVSARQVIRARYGLPHSSCDTICQDTCVWCCCMPCATMQEAMQVEFVELPAKNELQDIVQGVSVGETMPY